MVQFLFPSTSTGGEQGSLWGQYQVYTCLQFVYFCGEHKKGPCKNLKHVHFLDNVDSRERRGGLIPGC